MASGYSDLSEISKSSGAYGLYQKPPKINLISERPRRESAVEQQLSGTLTRANTNYYTYQQGPAGGIRQQFDPQHHDEQQQLQQQYPSPARSQGYRPATTTTTTSTLSQHQQMLIGAPTSSNQQSAQINLAARNQPSGPGASTMTTTTTTTTTRLMADGDRSNRQPGFTGTARNDALSSSSPLSMAAYYAELESDLAQKEARLKREIAHLNQKLSPWARPRQIREPRREPEPRHMRSEQRWVKECPSSSSSPRPNSRASSTRTNAGAELMDKASKLLQDAEELEKKPLQTQTILIEAGAKRRDNSSPSTGNLISSLSPSVSSVHTAVITVPNYEPDNKSPLPVAFDNFSTLGVRGNIASIGAAPPDTPYAPIFPVVKRTPSPMNTLNGRR